MEKEGLVRCLENMESNGLKIQYIVTDRDPHIQKFLREKNIPQFYDVWHFEKGIVSVTTVYVPHYTYVYLYL